MALDKFKKTFGKILDLKNCVIYNIKPPVVNGFFYLFDIGRIVKLY